MKICPRCGTEQDDNALFCSNCGTTFAVQPVITKSEPAAEETATEAIPVQIPVQPQYTQPVQPQYAQPVQYTQPAQPQYQIPVQQPAPVVRYNAYDHSKEFTSKDLADNKLFAALMYVTSLFGVLIALVADKDSPYLKFHIRQVLKLHLTMTILSALTAVLAWTVIVPIAGAIALLILFIVNIVCFVNVLKNRSIEPAFVRDLKFLQ